MTSEWTTTGWDARDGRGLRAKQTWVEAIVVLDHFATVVSGCGASVVV